MACNLPGGSHTSGSHRGASQLKTPFLRWIVGVAICLTILHLVLVYSWGRGHVLTVLPWDAVVMDSVTIVAALAVAVLAFGRFQVSPEPTPFWVGAAFSAFALFALFDSLTAPGTLPNGDGLLANLPSTSSWFWHLMLTALGLFLVFAAILPWPQSRLIAGRPWPLVAMMGGLAILLLSGLILAYQDSLPLLVVGSSWTPLNHAWSIVILLLFGAATVLAASRLQRASNLPCASLTLCLLFLTFAMVTDLIGTQLYDVWWYWRRILFALAMSVMLFGLLLEYIQLHRRERDRTKELWALQSVSSALMHETSLTSVADVIIDQSFQVLNVDAAEVWAADPVRRELTMLSGRGLDSAHRQSGCRMSFDAPAFAALIARTERVQRADELGASDVASLNYAEYVRDGLHSVIGIPLKPRDGLVGVVIFATKQPQGLSPTQMMFITSAAGLFAIEMENTRLFDEVRQALRLREEFVAAAAHELRSPVTVIQGRAELLLRAEPLDERTRRGLDSILRAAKRIDHLVDDLLAVLRVRPGAMTLHRERLDLSQLVRSVVEMARQSTQAYDLQFSGEEPLYVDADRALLFEVLNRLVENAMRLTPGGGAINVDARRRGRDAVVDVTHHGVVIPPERERFAFEPFYELIQGGSPGYTGLVSLGLYLSRQIVEAHGGRIWLASSPSGCATFSFSIPVAPTTGT